MLRFVCLVLLIGSIACANNNDPQLAKMLHKITAASPDYKFIGSPKTKISTRYEIVRQESPLEKQYLGAYHLGAGGEAAAQQIARKFLSFSSDSAAPAIQTSHSYISSAAPAISSYQVPAVSSYQVPAVSSYQAPAVSVAAAPAVSTFQTSLSGARYLDAHAYAAPAVSTVETSAYAEPALSVAAPAVSVAAAPALSFGASPAFSAIQRTSVSQALSSPQVQSILNAPVAVPAVPSTVEHKILGRPQTVFIRHPQPVLSSAAPRFIASSVRHQPDFSPLFEQMKEAALTTLPQSKEHVAEFYKFMDHPVSKEVDPFAQSKLPSLSQIKELAEKQYEQTGKTDLSFITGGSQILSQENNKPTIISDNIDVPATTADLPAPQVPAITTSSAQAPASVTITVGKSLGGSSTSLPSASFSVVDSNNEQQQQQGRRYRFGSRGSSSSVNYGVKG